ncbi:hypothetical protein [Paraburkholderia strydomiana]|uniref:hypothetical protein n=1 Tax=Paraburkholderia strydomiana TaxID=1245417 RepID=UPI0038B757D7
MPTRHSLTRPVVTVSAVLFLALTAGCSKPAEQGRAPSAPAASSQPAKAAQSGPASRLGDLTVFRDIATDVADMVDNGNLPAARRRIKDLEVAWDSAEAGLKPRAAADWHLLDRAIDNGLAALRTDAPNQADCEAAMAELLRTLDTLQGKA